MTTNTDRETLSDEFIRNKINPIVGYLVHSAAGARIAGLPDSADWEYLREGTRRIKELLESELAKRAAPTPARPPSDVLPSEPDKPLVVSGRRCYVERDGGNWIITDGCGLAVRHVLDAAGVWYGPGNQSYYAMAWPSEAAAEAAVRQFAEAEACLKSIDSPHDPGFLTEADKEKLNEIRSGPVSSPPTPQPAERELPTGRKLPNAVKQTTPSNCFAGCVASLLNVPIDEIPGVDGKAWDWSAFEDWLATKGLQAVEMTFGNGGTLYPVRVPVPCILSGKSPHGDRLHAVCAEFVGLDGFNLTHDPHESDKMIDGDPVHATFFVPLNPVAILQRLGNPSEIPNDWPEPIGGWRRADAGDEQTLSRVLGRLDELKNQVDAKMREAETLREKLAAARLALLNKNAEQDKFIEQLKVELAGLRKSVDALTTAQREPAELRAAVRETGESLRADAKRMHAEAMRDEYDPTQDAMLNNASGRMHGADLMLALVAVPPAESEVGRG